MLRCRLGLLALCFSGLVLAEARSRRKRWGKSSDPLGLGPRNKPPLPQRAPAVVEFKYATEIDADAFARKVESVANSTEKQAYFPFVMFHVSWCKHCQHTLPEFERAAEMVSKATEEGKLKGLSAELKFFVLQCDKSPAERFHCDKHPGGVPSLKLFRDNRTLGFTGNRYAKIIAEWSANVSRPVMFEVENNRQVAKLSEQGTLFILKADMTKEPAIAQTWMDLAFHHIEDAYFSTVSVDSEVGQLMPPAPSVTVQGKWIEALPFDGAMAASALKQWVSFNQWPVLVDLTKEKAVKLLKSGHPVVAYVFGFGRGYKKKEREAQVETLNRLRAKAVELRNTSKYIVGYMDSSVRENADFLSRAFPVVSIPSIFVFSGSATVNDLLYWEDPGLRDANELTLAALANLTRNDWARQDATTRAWLKGWAKRGYRFGSGSVFGIIIVFAAPCLLCLFCCFCLRELMATDEPFLPLPPTQKENKPTHQETIEAKHDKND